MSRPIDVMIIGAQKAGTTSLLRYLGEHPECMSHPQKEFAYFIDSKEYDNNYTRAFRKYFSASDVTSNAKIVAKSAGLYADENAIKRLYEHNPKCELIIILRNPVERAYSSYLMEKNYDSVKFEFSELPELIQKHNGNDESWGFSFFIEYGFYAKHLKNIYKHFPKEQVHVILYDEFKNNTLKVCQDIFNVIKIDNKFIPNVKVQHNVTQKMHSQFYAKLTKHILKKEGFFRRLFLKIIPTSKAYKYGEQLRLINKKNAKHSEMNDSEKQYLITFYKPHNDELENLIKCDLSNWNK